MISPFVRTALVLGLLSAVGPFAIDMYLPALPALAADLGSDVAAAQMSLMAFFIAFGVCQIVYGPVSDMVGRKAPLYFGMTVFAAASIGCALAPTIGWLIAFRFVQGIGAAAAAVIPRAIIRDLYTGNEATRLMSTIMLVFSVSPILAPLSGSGLVAAFGWRAVFVAVTVAAVLALFLLTLALRETRPVADRVRGGLGSVLRAYSTLIVHRRFIGLTFIGGLGMSSFFAFLASSSFIYIGHFGLTPTLYSFAFSINAVAFIGSAQFAGFLGQRFGARTVVRAAVGLFTIAALTLLGLTLAGVDSLAVLIVLLFIGNTGLGLVIPTTMVLALEEHGPIAGMASALGGTLQFLLGSVMIVIVSVLYNGTPLPMVAVIAACAAGAAIIAQLTLARRPSAVPARAAAPAE